MSSIPSSFGVVGYDEYSNIGDLFQTYALLRLLPGPAVCLERAAFSKVALPGPHQWVVCGFFHDESNHRYGLGKHDDDVLYAGVHIGKSTDLLKTNKHPIGCRDTYTRDCLLKNGVNAQWVGCASLTLPRYDGPRQGHLHIESSKPGLTQKWPQGKLTWPQRWTIMAQRLDDLRTAELVTTTRMHVITACLAMGTPVEFDMRRYHLTENPTRLVLLDDIGFKFGEVNNFSVQEFSTIYKAFLCDRLNSPLSNTQNPDAPPFT